MYICIVTLKPSLVEWKRVTPPGLHLRSPSLKPSLVEWKLSHAGGERR